MESIRVTSETFPIVTLPFAVKDKPVVTVVVSPKVAAPVTLDVPKFEKVTASPTVSVSSTPVSEPVIVTEPPIVEPPAIVSAPTFPESATTLMSPVNVPWNVN